MSNPKLFTVVRAPLGGRLGAETLWEQREICPDCGNTDHDKIVAMQFLVDFDEGHDLFTVQDHYAVTSRLRGLLETAKITGIEFRPAIADWNEEIVDRELDAVEKLPNIHHLAILDTLKAGPGWANPGEPCPTCARRSWSITPTGIASLTASDKGNGPHRSLHRSTYSGQDVLQMDDFGRPVVSQRFRDLLAEAGVEGMVYQPIDIIES